MSLNFLRISGLLHLYLTESCCKQYYIYVDKYFGGSTKENQEKTTQKTNLRTTVIAEIILDSIEVQILWGVEIPSLSK